MKALTAVVSVCAYLHTGTVCPSLAYLHLYLSVFKSIRLTFPRLVANPSVLQWSLGDSSDSICSMLVSSGGAGLQVSMSYTILFAKKQNITVNIFLLISDAQSNQHKLSEIK